MQRAFDAEIKVLTNFEEKKIRRNFEKNLADWKLEKIAAIVLSFPHQNHCWKSFIDI